MARPRLVVRPVYQKITLSLRPGEDDDIIDYLSQAKVDGRPLAQAVIAAMRGGLAETGAELSADIDDELVDELLDMVF